MIKQVYVPLHVSERETGDLLEFYTHPEMPKAESGDIYTGLVGAGLEPGITKTKRLLRQLNLATGKGMIYCINSQPPVINPESTALGLLLISLISKQSCVYSSVIVCADISEDIALTLISTGYWRQKYAAILTLGKQQANVPLILPATFMPELVPDSLYYKQLKANNIQPYYLANVSEVANLIMP